MQLVPLPPKGLVSHSGFPKALNFNINDQNMIVNYHYYNLAGPMYFPYFMGPNYLEPVADKIRFIMILLLAKLPKVAFRKPNRNID